MPTLKRMWIISTAVLPLVAAILWHVLDASPSLWLYDRILQAGGIPPSFATRSNSTVWVTGASSGIGAALVCELAVAGARHVILSARRLEAMQEVIETCHCSEGKNGQPIFTTFSIVPYDAMVEELTPIVVEQALESTPTESIDILVLNSGVYQAQPALITTAEYRKRLFRVNVEAPIDLSQSLIELNGWKERGRGHLVVVSSMAAKGPQSLSTTYGATKAALKSYFQSLSTEEWEWLQVSLILPGATATNLWQSASDVSASPVQPDVGACMTPQRVAQLIARSITVRPSWLSRVLWFEVWITKPIGLLYGYLSHYTPTLFYHITHLVGLARVQAWHEYHLDMLELPFLIQTFWDVLWRKVFPS